MVETVKGDISELEAATGRKVSRPRAERRPMNWQELQNALPPPRRWRIEHWLSTGPTLFAGAGGVGKSLVAQTVATALALGVPYIDTIKEPSTVLYWACEDDHDELWRRQVDICRFFQVKLGELEGRLIIEPRLGKTNTLFYAEHGALHWTEQFDEFKAQVVDHKADITFLDNIGQTFGGNENDRHHVTSYVNGLAGVAPNHSMVILGHPAKSNGSEFSGSSAWENSVRMRWFLSSQLPDQTQKQEDFDQSEEDLNTRYISKRKTNYTVKDYRKLCYHDGVLAPERGAGEYIRSYSHEQRAAAAVECVLKAIDRFVASGIRTTDSRNSPDYLPKKMIEMRQAEDFSRRELTEAVNKLRLEGTITDGEIGKFANRTKKMGLVRSAIHAA